MPFILKEFVAPQRTKAFLFLMRNLALSQKEAQRLIAKGRVFIADDLPLDDPAGWVEGPFRIVVFEPATRHLKPIFVTPRFALFDKPSGVLVHPQNRHTAYSMVDEIRYQFGRDANITHRIDQETSGLLLAARDKGSERFLKMAFESRDMRKRYRAFVRGRLDHYLCIDAPLLRRPEEEGIVRLLVRVHPEGKPSRTEVRPLRYFPDLDITLIEAIPFTGRQHQIRVHMFHVKHPIVGDPIYGQKSRNIVAYLDKCLTADKRISNTGAERLMLHADKLEFYYEGVDYSVRTRVDFEAEGLRLLRELDTK